MVYKELIENYQEFWYTGENDKEYDQHIALLTHYLEQYTLCTNEAVYHGSDHQSVEWQIKMMESASYIAENKLLKTILRQEKNEERIKVFQSMFSKINTMNYDALRRICWKLGKLYFKKSVIQFENCQFKNALALTNDSLQFLDRFRMCQNKF